MTELDDAFAKLAKLRDDMKYKVDEIKALAVKLHDAGCPTFGVQLKGVDLVVTWSPAESDQLLVYRGRAKRTFSEMSRVDQLRIGEALPQIYDAAITVVNQEIAHLESIKVSTGVIAEEAAAGDPAEEAGADGKVKRAV